MSVIDNLAYTGDADVVLDSSNKPVAIDSLAQTFAYDGSGNLITITSTDGISSWVQTLGYTAGKVTSISRWVKQ